jgi:hypothetical protein
MRSSSHALDGLSSLHLVGDAESRRALWRSSLASLASALLDERRAAPLEGVAADQLLHSVQVAMADRLFDDVDFLAPESAGAALYEIAAALPAGEVKRELGRRTLSRLRAGDAKTFVGLGMQLALTGGKRALTGPSIRARVALAVELPLGIGTRADALALALISRRELSREWLTHPSTGSLPARRMSARLLERAAREAARRAQRGDDSGVRIFESRAVVAAMSALGADRESLVWRHVASAHGLLSAAIPAEWTEIERGLDPSLGVTEWRRSAAALAASIAVRGEASLRVCKALLSSPIIGRDPGLFAALILGLPRAMESDPALVEPMLDHLVRQGGLEAIEALVELRRERLGDTGDAAYASARAILARMRALRSDADEGRLALVEALLHDLGKPGDPQRTTTLRELIHDAHEAFATLGASSAHLLAQTALRGVFERVAELERCELGDREGRMDAFRILRELDVAVLESDALVSLLLLGPRADDEPGQLRPLSEIFDRLVSWLERCEGARVADQPVRDVDVLLRMRRVRTLLHVVDSDGPQLEERPELLRDRRLRVAGLLFQRVARDRASALHRALCAAAARACDAMVREESAEVSDVVLVAASSLAGAADLETLAEASMMPELKAPLIALAKLAAGSTQVGNELGPASDLAALRGLAQALPVAASMRIEAMRGELLTLCDALEPMTWVASLAELADYHPDASLDTLELSLRGLVRVLRGSKRKLMDATDVDVAALEPLRPLEVALERRLRGLPVNADDELDAALRGIRQLLPGPFARVVGRCLKRAAALPSDGPRSSRVYSLGPPKEAPLPAWMPTSRTLGGFYVARPLGIGAGGTVFLARRAEHRHDDKAEHFALKVPDYSGAAARTLSEAEFTQLFREEAGALLMLPSHANIARFVTFDAGARPKSILVMELVEGPSLERLLEARRLDVATVLDLLDGIASGLEAMHAVGIAHLDLKPANVIVREVPGERRAPVLVDFGLAGRRVRPGCGTLDYSAPEIWGFRGPGPHAGAPADAYAFACMSYELLTGDTLFEAPNEMAMITRHASHDGMPESLATLHAEPRTRLLAEVLEKGLRAAPADRAGIATLRSELAALTPTLSRLSWPLTPAPLASSAQ